MPVRGGGANDGLPRAVSSRRIRDISHRSVSAGKWWATNSSTARAGELAMRLRPVSHAATIAAAALPAQNATPALQARGAGDQRGEDRREAQPDDGVGDQSGPPRAVMGFAQEQRLVRHQGVGA